MLIPSLEAEAIQEQHSSKPLVTCNRSISEPIDGIYTFSTIIRIHGIYVAFSKLGGDYRGLILDIPDVLIFGYTLSCLVLPCA